MSILEDLKASLRGDSRRKPVATDRELAASLTKIWDASDTELEALGSSVSDSEAYRTLIVAVKVSRAQNDSLSHLQAWVAALGNRVVCVAKEVAEEL